MMKKCIIAVVYGAGLYQIWQAQNWKIFRNSTLHKRVILQQIQTVIRERVDMVKNSKRARKSSHIIKRICSYKFSYCLFF